MGSRKNSSTKPNLPQCLPGYGCYHRVTQTLTYIFAKLEFFEESYHSYIFLKCAVKQKTRINIIQFHDARNPKDSTET